MLLKNYLLDKHNLTITYVDFLPYNASALIIKNDIFMLNGLTEAEENTLIAEEICHKSLTSGNILRTKNLWNVKQELLARRKAHYLLIPFAKLKECFDEGLTEYYEVAEYLNVTEKFLREAVINFRQKFGYMYHDKKTDCYFNFGNTIHIYKEDNNSYLYDYGC